MQPAPCCCCHVVCLTPSHSPVLRRAEDTNRTAEQLSRCGIQFCPGDEASASIERPSDEKIYTLATIYLACSLVAPAVVFFLVDPLSRYGD